jgi:hypothetical protein
MTRLLTLHDLHHHRMGEVSWDDKAGTFTGTDAVNLNGCAAYPQWHPGFPPTDALAKTDERALIVLLATLGWDCPELAETARKWRKEAGEPPPEAVA